MIKSDEKCWKVTNVKQPHTCGTADIHQEHSQCTARYLGLRIAPMVWADCTITVAALIEAIHGFTSYRVKYGKAWRAKQFAMAHLWGDWKESYSNIPKMLAAIAHFNSGTKYIIDTDGRQQMQPCGSILPVLYRVFWCFPQCVAAFKHCRPVMSVDATFLTGTYKGTLMVAVAIDAEDQLIPIAFAVTEGENNSSWSWFITNVRRHVIGPERRICMISDRHQGLLNAAREELQGFPPLVHRWCMRHFAANVWRRQKSKDVIKRLKLLCKAKEVRKFDTQLEEIQKIMNDSARDWLREQLVDKSK